MIESSYPTDHPFWSGFCMKDGSVAVVGPFDLDKTLGLFHLSRTWPLCPECRSDILDGILHGDLRGICCLLEGVVREVSPIAVVIMWFAAPARHAHLGLPSQRGVNRSKPIRHRNTLGVAPPEHGGDLRAAAVPLRRGVPQGAAPLGIDERGREVLTFIDGVVPVPPFAKWSMSNAALESAVGLQRRFHETAAGMPAGRHRWRGAGRARPACRCPHRRVDP